MRQKSFSQRLIRLIASDKFFWAVTAFLILQAAWIALSGRYPMAFDEDFHLGIIRLYAHHLSPFWAHQPAGANAFGAVARDPSYLYQYLMSFPYRLINLFTTSQTVMVLILRFINIALFTSGFVLFRRVLLKTGAKKVLINLALLIFSLLPVVPLLAAQINYDNLLLPVTALTLLLTMRFSDELKAQRLNVRLLLSLLCLCLLGCLVKYAFLPIALIVMLYLLVRLKQTFGLDRRLLKAFKVSWGLIGRAHKVLLIGLGVLSLTLFIQRYAVNLVRYHNPVPDCNQVLSVSACSAYGPWIRDYNFKINKVDIDLGPEKSLPQFSADWFYGMWLRIFFTVDGPGTSYQSRGPLPLPAISAIMFSVFGLFATLWTLKRLLKRYDAGHIVFLLVVSATYTLALWVDEFRSFLATGQPVAINGRYILPVILLVILLMLMGVSELLRHKGRRFKVGLLGVVVLCQLWGGGALTYILRSNDAWYWQSQPVYDANHAVQKILAPLTPGDSNPAEFLSLGSHLEAGSFGLLKVILR